MSAKIKVILEQLETEKEEEEEGAEGGERGATQKAGNEAFIAMKKAFFDNEESKSLEDINKLLRAAAAKTTRPGVEERFNKWLDKQEQFKWNRGRCNDKTAGIYTYARKCFKAGQEQTGKTIREIENRYNTWRGQEGTEGDDPLKAAQQKYFEANSGEYDKALANAAIEEADEICKPLKRGASYVQYLKKMWGQADTQAELAVEPQTPAADADEEDKTKYKTEKEQYDKNLASNEKKAAKIYNKVINVLKGMKCGGWKAIDARSTESHIHEVAAKCPGRDAPRKILKCMKGAGAPRRRGGRRRRGRRGPQKYGFSNRIQPPIKKLQRALQKYINARKKSKITTWAVFKAMEARKQTDSRLGKATYNGLIGTYEDMAAIIKAKMEAAKTALEASKTTARQERVKAAAGPAPEKPHAGEEKKKKEELKEVRLNKLGALLKEKFNIPKPLLLEDLAEDRQKYERLKAAYGAIETRIREIKGKKDLLQTDIDQAIRYMDAAGLTPEKNVTALAKVIAGDVGVARRRAAVPVGGGQPISRGAVVGALKDVQQARQQAKTIKSTLQQSRFHARAVQCSASAKGAVVAPVQLIDLGTAIWLNPDDKETAAQNFVTFLETIDLYLSASTTASVFGNGIGQSQQGLIKEFATKQTILLSAICITNMMHSIIMGFGQLANPVNARQLADLSNKGTAGSQWKGREDPRWDDVQRWTRVILSLISAAEIFKDRANDSSPETAAIIRAAIGGDPKSLDKAIEDWDRKKGVHMGGVGEDVTERDWVWQSKTAPSSPVKVSQSDLYELIRSGVAKDDDGVKHPSPPPNGTNNVSILIKQLYKVVPKPFGKLGGVGVGKYLRSWAPDDDWVDKCQNNIKQCIKTLSQKAESPKCRQYEAAYKKFSKTVPGCKQIIQNHAKWRVAVDRACRGDLRVLGDIDKIEKSCIASLEKDPCQKKCAAIGAAVTAAVTAARADGDDAPCKRFMAQFKQHHKRTMATCRCTNGDQIAASIRDCKATTRAAARSPQEEVSLNEQRLNKLAAKVRKKLLNE